MRRVWVISVAGLAAAGCSSTPDFCDQFSTALNGQENSIGGCGVDGGNVTSAVNVLGGEFPFSIAACAHQLPSCDAADVQQLNAVLKCVQALPAFQCDWLAETDSDGGVVDGGLEAYQTAVQQCASDGATISAGCRGSLDTGGCGVETHTANSLPTDPPLPLNLGLPTTDCLGATDTHYLSITAPAATPGGIMAGGYFEITFDEITQDVVGQLVVKLADQNLNLLDNAQYAFDSRAGIFLAAQPSSEFILEVSGDTDDIPLGYTVTASFVTINDSYKPDRDYTLAKPIKLGEETNDSYCWAGQLSSLSLIPGPSGDFDDWFSVTMPGPGTATIQLKDFPGDFAPGAEFLDPSRSTIVPETCPGCTGNKTNLFDTLLYYKAQVASGGQYFVHVYPNQVNHATYANYSLGTLQANPVLPAHFTTPYSLTVSFAAQ